MYNSNMLMRRGAIVKTQQEGLAIHSEDNQQEVPNCWQEAHIIHGSIT